MLDVRSLSVQLTVSVEGAMIFLGTALFRTPEGGVEMSTAARLDMRLDSRVKEKAEKASALLGLRSLTDYVVRLIEEDATRVIAEHESITVEDDVFDRFMHACAKAEGPNAALRDALRFTRKSGVE